MRRRWTVLIVLSCVLVALVIAAFVAAHYTSRSSFCDTCHEMDPYYSSWMASSHASAECADCHIPPGIVPYVETKLFSLREVWVHITGGTDVPLAVTREIPNESCYRCHSTPQDMTLQGVTFSHAEHEEEYCIDCHVRIVHTDVNPPSYTSPGTMDACVKCHDGTRAAGECSLCHEAPHEPRGECAACHNIDSWSGAVEHPFPRTGGHAGLACTDCHVSRPGSQLIPGTDLPRPSPECVSCHGDQHGGLTDCADCHNTNAWEPSTFTHPQVGEHIPRGEHPLSCTDCHTTGFGSQSCSCHGGNPPNGSDD